MSNVVSDVLAAQQPHAPDGAARLQDRGDFESQFHINAVSVYGAARLSASVRPLNARGLHEGELYYGTYLVGSMWTQERGWEQIL